MNRNDIKDTGLKLSYKLNKMKGLIFGLEHIIHDNELYIENDKNPILKSTEEHPSQVFSPKSPLGIRVIYI